MSDAVLDSPDAIRDHLEEAIEPAERGRRGVRFVLCDRANRVLVHCPVEGIPDDSDADDCVQTISVFATALTGTGSDGGAAAAASARSAAMLVVLTRPGTSLVTDSDRLWFRAAHEVCAEYGVRLLGVHLMTLRQQREIVLDDAL
jgi:hypothetical protein